MPPDCRPEPAQARAVPQGSRLIHKDHFELGLSNVAVRIRTPKDEEARQAMLELNDKPVRLIGHFVNDGRSAVPMWAGSVRLESLSKLPPRIEEELTPLLR